MKRTSLAITLGVALALVGTVALAARNSSGTYTLSPSAPFSANTVISSSTMNTRWTDMGTEMTDSLSRSGKGGMLAALRGVNGTVGIPAYSFTSDTDTGLYLSGANALGLALGGVEYMDWSTSLVSVAIPAEFVSSVTVDGVLTLDGDLTANDPASFASSITVTGYATFLGSTMVPTPVSSTEAAHKGYVDGYAFSPTYVGTNWTATNTSYTRAGKMVTLQFTLTASGSASRDDMMVLPAGYRPAALVHLPGYWYSAGIYQPAIFQISTAGKLATLYGHDGVTFVGVSGTSGATDSATGIVTFYAGN